MQQNNETKWITIPDEIKGVVSSTTTDSGSSAEALYSLRRDLTPVNRRTSKCRGPRDANIRQIRIG